MAYLKYLILALLFFANASFAGYAQLKPPPGWSQGMGAAVPGTAGTFNFGAAANGSTFKGTTVLTNAALSVAGNLVTVPVALRTAANASVFAASYSFGNPLLFAGLAAGSLLYDYYNNQGLTVKDGLWVHTDSSICTTAPCYMYSTGYLESSSPSVACQAGVGHYVGGDIANSLVASSGMPSPSCTYIMGWGYTQGKPMFYRLVSPSPVRYTPIGDPEFHSIMDPVPFPSGVPQLLPIPLPVEEPLINPDPSGNPRTNPWYVPTGNPVPTPDPNVWNQPVVRVTPSPTPDSPWRVDLQPENIPQNSPTSKTPAELNPPVPDPNGPPVPKSVPKPNPGLCDEYPNIAACQPAAKPEDKIDFCKENPDVLACQKLDTPSSDDLETKDKTIAITPDSGWGSAVGSCPAPRRFSKGEFSFQIYCDFASGIKPVIIAVAWLVAAGILIGFKFGES